MPNAFQQTFGAFNCGPGLFLLTVNSVAVLVAGGDVRSPFALLGLVAHLHIGDLPSKDLAMIAFPLSSGNRERQRSAREQLGNEASGAATPFADDDTELAQSDFDDCSGTVDPLTRRNGFHDSVRHGKPSNHAAFVAKTGFVRSASDSVSNASLSSLSGTSATTCATASEVSTLSQCRVDLWPSKSIQTRLLSQDDSSEAALASLRDQSVGGNQASFSSFQTTETSSSNLSGTISAVSISKLHDSVAGARKKASTLPSIYTAFPDMEDDESSGPSVPEVLVLQQPHPNHFSSQNDEIPYIPAKKAAKPLDGASPSRIHSDNTSHSSACETLDSSKSCEATSDSIMNASCTSMMSMGEGSVSRRLHERTYEETLTARGGAGPVDVAWNPPLAQDASMGDQFDELNWNQCTSTQGEIEKTNKSRAGLVPPASRVSSNPDGSSALSLDEVRRSLADMRVRSGLDTRSSHESTKQNPSYSRRRILQRHSSQGKDGLRHSSHGKEGQVMRRKSDSRISREYGLEIGATAAELAKTRLETPKTKSDGCLSTQLNEAPPTDSNSTRRSLSKTRRQLSHRDLARRNSHRDVHSHAATSQSQDTPLDGELPLSRQGSGKRDGMVRGSSQRSVLNRCQPANRTESSHENDCRTETMDSKRKDSMKSEAIKSHRPTERSRSKRNLAERDPNRTSNRERSGSRGRVRRHASSGQVLQASTDKTTEGTPYIEGIAETPESRRLYENIRARLLSHYSSADGDFGRRTNTDDLAGSHDIGRSCTEEIMNHIRRLIHEIILLNQQQHAMIKHSERLRQVEHALHRAINQGLKDDKTRSQLLEVLLFASGPGNNVVPPIPSFNPVPPGRKVAEEGETGKTPGNNWGAKTDDQRCASTVLYLAGSDRRQEGPESRTRGSRLTNVERAHLAASRGDLIATVGVVVDIAGMNLVGSSLKPSKRSSLRRSTSQSVPRIGRKVFFNQSNLLCAASTSDQQSCCPSLNDPETLHIHFRATLNRDDFTEEEIANYWWTPGEMSRLRAAVRDMCILTRQQVTSLGKAPQTLLGNFASRNQDGLQSSDSSACLIDDLDEAFVIAQALSRNDNFNGIQGSIVPRQFNPNESTTVFSGIEAFDFRSGTADQSQHGQGLDVFLDLQFRQALTNPVKYTRGLEDWTIANDDTSLVGTSQRGLEKYIMRKCRERAVVAKESRDIVIRHQTVQKARPKNKHGSWAVAAEYGGHGKPLIMLARMYGHADAVAAAIAHSVVDFGHE
jgi:hypothetical protein